MRGAVVDNYSNYGGSNYSNYGGSNYSNYGGSNLGYGERSGAQRGLKVLAILHVVGGVLMLLALLFMWSLYVGEEAGAGGSLASRLIQQMRERGIVISESELAALIFVLALKAFLVSVAVLLTGVFGIRAANDPEKVMPYLVISGILLAYAIFDVLEDIFAQTFTFTILTLIGVGIPTLAVWLGVSVKQQRDQARMPGAQW